MYYTSVLPLDIKTLQLYYIHNKELIDISNNTDSLFYTSKCEDLAFWKQKIALDFSISSNYIDKVKHILGADSATCKEVVPLDPNRITSVLNSKTLKMSDGSSDNSITESHKSINTISGQTVFKEIDFKWLYRVLYYYFSLTNKDNYYYFDKVVKKSPFFDSYDLLECIVIYAGDYATGTPLFDEVMKNAKLVNFLLRKVRTDGVFPYIYRCYPQYRKIILLHIIFARESQISYFRTKYNPTETFTFSELAELILGAGEQPIIDFDEQEYENFENVLFKIFLKP
jgi:hypothetical protein